jgi:hypothetical protein
MERFPVFSVFGAILRVVLAVAPLTVPVSGQVFTSLLVQTRGQLESLRFCLGPDFEPLQELQHGLLTGYNGQGYGDGGGSAYGGRRGLVPPSEPIPPPPAYTESLEQDIKACKIAGKLKGDEKQALLDQVRKDVEIKAKDCRKFGMGRMVSVRVTTVRGPQMDDGWEVYYKWDCSSAFQPKELRAPKLTNPAILQLPPGNYLIRAQKQQGGQTMNTESARVAVGLEKSAEVQIPIQ